MHNRIWVYRFGVNMVHFRYYMQISSGTLLGFDGISYNPAKYYSIQRGGSKFRGFISHGSAEFRQRIYLTPVPTMIPFTWSCREFRQRIYLTQVYDDTYFMASQRISKSVFMCDVRLLGMTRVEQCIVKDLYVINIPLIVRNT